MTGPTIVVLPDDPLPPYEQVRRQLEELIRGGELAGGTRLPTVRQLAGDLGVAAGTVGRAYRELESVGLVETRRAAGTRVAADLPRLLPEERSLALGSRAREYVARARLLGADRESILSAVQEALG